MPRVLSLKKLKGKKDAAHPNSRKSHQIQRAALRSERLAQQSKQKQTDHYRTINRFGFFKIIAETASTPAITDDQLVSLIQTYIDRNAAMIKDLTAERRPNRAKPTQLDQLERLRDLEMGEFSSGFKVPRMDREEDMKRLREWKGDVGGLTRIQTVSIRRPVDQVPQPISVVLPDVTGQSQPVDMETT